MEFKPRMKFTLDEVMDALDEAFSQSHPRTSRDCVVERKLRTILSARPEHLGNVQRGPWLEIVKHQP
jgi:hypothetical protein